MGHPVPLHPSPPEGPKKVASSFLLSSTSLHASPPHPCLNHAQLDPGPPSFGLSVSTIYGVVMFACSLNLTYITHTHICIQHCPWPGRQVLSLPSFTEKETKTQRGKATFLTSHSTWKTWDSNPVALAFPCCYSLMQPSMWWASPTLGSRETAPGTEANTPQGGQSCARGVAGQGA